MTAAVPASPLLSAAPSARTGGAAASASPPCDLCVSLAADSRRREPHERLVLPHTAPLVSESAAGIPYSMLTFHCRECGTVWRLYDRANELFVSWARGN